MVTLETKVSELVDKRPSSVVQFIYRLKNTVKSRNMLFFYSNFMIQYCYDFNETRFRLAFGTNLGFGYYL